MNTAPVELKTTNGYTAVISNWMTYGQYMLLQNILTGAMSVDPTTGTVKELNASVINEANVQAFKMLLIKLTDPNGNEISEPGKAMDDLPAQDGIEIMEEINKIWVNTSPSKKKGI